MHGANKELPIVYVLLKKLPRNNIIGGSATQIISNVWAWIDTTTFFHNGGGSGQLIKVRVNCHPLTLICSLALEIPLTVSLTQVTTGYKNTFDSLQ